MEKPPLAEAVRVRVVECLVGLWFFALGASIGSFVNVVAYRLPLGRSLWKERSRCRTCATPVAGRDNLPILGWWLLGGKCRACGSEISIRYPLVELLVGLVFLTLFLVQLISGGANLPLRIPNHYHGVVWVILYPKWDLIGWYAFHCCTYSTLVAWMLIDRDRQTLRLRYLALPLGLCLVCAAFFPAAHVVPLLRERLSEFQSPGRWHSLLSAGLGLVAGGVLGGLLVLFSRGAEERRHNSWLTAGLGLLGAGLGPYAVLGSGVIWFVLRAILALPLPWPSSLRRLEPLALLLAAAIVHHVCWRMLVHGGVPWWPGPVSREVQWAVQSGMLLAGIVMERNLPNRYNDFRTVETETSER
jgi:leader peptidase (prepilin peptidase)/N-methyltransferase